MASLSRRSFLRLGRRAEAPVAPSRKRFPLVLRPPGAVAEELFQARCTRCGDCAKACPPRAIVAAKSAQRELQGLPIIDPMEQACLLCSDRPCICACETSALVPGDAPMGRAYINQLDCLNSLGNMCTTCVELCPTEGAIHLRESRVEVQASACTGCGQCAYACPAPRKAIAILANPSRPG